MHRSWRGFVTAGFRYRLPKDLVATLRLWLLVVQIGSLPSLASRDGCVPGRAPRGGRLASDPGRRRKRGDRVGLRACRFEPYDAVTLADRSLMAVPEHLSAFLAGPGESRGASLGGLDLRNAEIPVSELKDVTIRGIDLSGAAIHKVEWKDVHLVDAVLHGSQIASGVMTRVRLDNLRASRARIKVVGIDNVLMDFCIDACDLSSTAFYRTMLLGGSFEGATSMASAKLNRATFERVDFGDTDFTHADFGPTVFAACDFSGARNLDLGHYIFPIYVDPQTLSLSPELPLKFLQGAGLSDEFISFYRSLGAAIRFYTAFISYSSSQQEFADRLYADLQRENIRCWLATEHLRIGDRFRQTIDDAIRIHDKLLLIFSADAVQSEWVEDEVNAALDRERRRGEEVLFPITVDGAIWDTDRAWARAIRDKRHIGDFRGWGDDPSYSKAFVRLLRDLRR